MTDRSAIDTMTAQCEQYWRAAGIGRRAAAEMHLELEQHLVEAVRDGRDPRSVVGDDITTFAMEWAAAAGSSPESLPAWDDVFARRRRGIRWTDTAILAVVAAAIFVGAITRGQGDGMDTETWRWIWIGAALFLGFAEMVTAGFFMLPFAVGAAVAAVLAFMDVAPTIELIVFIATSLVALIWLQRFIRHADERQEPVGANRFIGRTAIVLEPIDRTAGTGRVRMDTEEWRSTTDGDPIPTGTEVNIIEVRGTRLVVEPTE